MADRGLPAYAVVGGNPGSVIKLRFDPAVIELQALAWWNWPVDRISRNFAVIMGAELDALRAAI